MGGGCGAVAAADVIRPYRSAYRPGLSDAELRRVHEQALAYLIALSFGASPGRWPWTAPIAACDVTDAAAELRDRGVDPPPSPIEYE